MGVWNEPDDVGDEAWRGEWGPGGRERFERYRERAWEREQAEAEAAQLRSVPRQSPGVVRHLVFGVLAVEGLVSLAIGFALALTYWPATRNGLMHHPVSYVGVGICFVSLAYLAIVGIFARVYEMVRPAPAERPTGTEDAEFVDAPKKVKLRGWPRLGGR